MATAVEITETVQDGILKSIETGQRLTLDALSAAVSTIDGVLPERPTVPFVTAFATPKEALDTSFRLAERLLESQRTFLAEVIGIAYPTRPAPSKRPAAS